MLYAANLFQFAESVLSDLRFNFIRSDPPASLVIVAIDPKSIAEIGVWPWPRRMHAAVLTKLIDAGAARVAFDIDFSSASTPENDLALEQALARSGDKAILPVFKQLTREADGSHRLITTVPLARFQGRAALASINVRPDSDGKVRRINRITEVGGRILPTLSAALANEPVSLNAIAFDVDYGIRSENIERISFVNVLTGRVDPAFVAGKKFIIGATAVELGDQLSVPLHRAMPGVMVQALAYASLARDRALQPLPLLVTIALILALSLLVVPRFATLSWKPGLMIAVTGSIAIFGISFAISAAAPVFMEIVPLIIVLIAGYGASLVVQIDAQKIRLFVSSMALQRQMAIADVILETSGHATVTINHDGKIDIFNPAAEEMFGAAAKDVAGQPFENLFVHDEGKYRGDFLNPGLMVFDLGKPRDLEAVRKDGTHIFVEIIAKPVNHIPSTDPLEKRKNVRTTYVCTLIDVTKRKELELLEYTARIQAQSANKAKSTFLANMSHELRTPLNAILGFSQFVLSEKSGSLNPQQKEYIGHISSSGDHLLSLINDVLDISRIESDRFELHKEVLDAELLITNSRRFVEQRATANRVKLSSEIDPEAANAWGDERAVTQVLVNLLGNAVKFTPPGGEINIKVSCGENGATKIMVSDTGRGIHPDEIATVMEPFGQASKVNGETIEGTGLGLTLARQLVEMHDGSLTLESRYGVGTDVTIYLPQPEMPIEGVSVVH